MRDEDLVLAGEATDAEPVLIELEALDPCLHLGQARGAAARLADAVKI